jgi:hypothetical protein
MWDIKTNVIPVIEQENDCNTVFPRDIVCLRNVSINTPYKGDDDDNNVYWGVLQQYTTSGSLLAFHLLMWIKYSSHLSEYILESEYSFKHLICDITLSI